MLMQTLYDVAQIGDLMEWVDTKMEEGNELGMEVPELDFILLLSAESDDQLHKELKQQLGDFPYPCGKSPVMSSHGIAHFWSCRGKLCHAGSAAAVQIRTVGENLPIVI